MLSTLPAPPSRPHRRRNVTERKPTCPVCGGGEFRDYANVREMGGRLVRGKTCLKCGCQWAESDLAIAEATFRARLLREPVVEKSKQLRELVGQYYDQIGDCDHAVNICRCGIKAWMDEYDDALAALGEAK
jgi:hypothetical protein